MEINGKISAPKLPNWAKYPMIWLPEAKPPPTWVPNHMDATVKPIAHEFFSAFFSILTLLFFYKSSFRFFSAAWIVKTQIKKPALQKAT
jgi:hypothetical protein